VKSEQEVAEKKLVTFTEDAQGKEIKNPTYRFLRDRINCQLVQALALRRDCCLQFAVRNLQDLVMNKTEIFRNANVRTSYLRSHESIGGKSIALYSDSPEYGGNKSLRNLVPINQSTGRNILEE
jgi:hypothetical protein